MKKTSAIALAILLSLGAGSGLQAAGDNSETTRKGEMPHDRQINEDLRVQQKDRQDYRASDSDISSDVSRRIEDEERMSPDKRRVPGENRISRIERKAETYCEKDGVLQGQELQDCVNDVAAVMEGNRHRTAAGREADERLEGGRVIEDTTVIQKDLD